MTVHKQRLFRHALALPLATWILFAAGPSRADDEAVGPAAEAAGNSLQEDVGHGESDAQAFDNSHKNASPTIMHPQEFKSDLALFTLVVFILLLAILLKFAWGPITQGLEKREQGIADHIDQARLDAEQAAETLEQYKQQLQEAVREAQQIVAQARQDAEAAGDQIVAEAKQAAGRERDRALEAIEVATRSALDEVAQRGTEIAVDLAGRIIARELDAADHATLIRDSMDQFASNN